MKRLSLILISVLFLNIACEKHFYQNPNFSSAIQGHKRIAILPAEITFTGKLPRVTDEQYNQILIAESKIAQEGLANSLMMNSSEKEPLMVTIQNISETNRLLQNQNILEINQKSSAELCQILGVDAVVKQHLKKQRFMSDYTSYGIDVLSDILSQIPNTIGGIDVNSPIPNATYEIEDEVVISSKTSDDVLWKSNFTQQANWSYSPEQIQRDIYRKIAKNFPYRQIKNK